MAYQCPISASNYASRNRRNLGRYHLTTYGKMFYNIDYRTQFEWEDVFRESDILSSEVWSSHLTGSLIDVGDFPNAIAIYKKYIREIRKIFTPKHNFLSTARRRLQRLHERRLSVSRLSNATYIDLKPLQSDVNSTFVSVHVRRSDYSHHLAVLYNLTYVDDDFFRRAFKYFRDKYHVEEDEGFYQLKWLVIQLMHDNIRYMFDFWAHGVLHLLALKSSMNALFYVVSDDLEWCRATLEAVVDVDDKIDDRGRDVFFAGSLHKFSHVTSFDEIGVDLALLSLANHSILTYGTFGMWGALMAGGDAVMPASHAVTKEQKEIEAAKLYRWISL